MKVGLKRREENPDYTGKEPFNYFLAVLFPDEELKILPYNRVVKDLNGLGQEDFLAAAAERFDVAAWGILAAGNRGQTPSGPGKREHSACFSAADGTVSG